MRAGMLFGRTVEVDRMDGLLERARSGRGGALLLVGEPGIGKTALLSEAQRRADGMAVAATAGVESEADLPFAALGEIAAPLLEHIAALPSPQATAIRAALALEAPSVPPDRLAILAGFLGLLRSAAADRPLLVLVDDAHWLDSPSAECLGYAARRLEGSPVVVIAAARDEDVPAALRAPVSAEIQLRGLRDADALALLESSVSGLSAPAAKAVVAAAVGNPLALLELPPLLSDAQRSGVAPLDPIPAPSGVLRDAFERRLGGLDADARTALLVAAAALDHEAAPVVGACRSLGIPDAAIERAEEAGLLSLAGDRLRLAHPLLRASVYHDAAAPKRRRAHAALADHSPEDGRAWHLAAAALGPDAEAADALEAAAARASTRGAHSTAADALERAAQLTDEPGARARRLLGAGLAAGLGGAYKRAEALLEPAAEIDDPVLRAHVRHLLAMVTLTGGTRPAVTNHELLEDEAARIEGRDPSLAATLHADAGLTAVVGGDCRLALAAAERGAAALPDDAPDMTRCQVVSMLGMALSLRGRTADARAALDEAGELLPSVDPLTPAAQSIAFALGGRLSTGQERHLRTELLSLIGLARERGTRGLLPYDQLLAAHAGFRLGEWDEAEREADDAIAIANDSGQHGPLSIALVIRARIHAARGQEAEARAGAARGMELAVPPGYGAALIWARAMLGFLELGLGRPDAAIAELEQARQLAELAGLEDPLIVPWAADLVEAYAHAGRSEDAEALSAALEAKVSGSDVSLARAVATRADGIAARGDFAKRFERALKHHTDAEAPFELARTQLAFGSRLHRARRRVAAREHLREALAAFERLGAGPWIERTGAELRAAGAKRRVPVGDPDELTAQELRVARAVAGGATNREVASELFLSPKTIEFHLGHVYRKLGIRSRIELATLVAEGELENGRP